MNKKIKFYLVPILLIVVSLIIIKAMPKKNSDELVKEVNPSVGSIQTIISTTGSVLPKNRLEIKPPVAGRLESILVKEGEFVKTGQTLAWMSSTERAALLDAARGEGAEKLKYWQEAYKPIELLAPIDGEIIVAVMQPGQTVTTSEAVVVLSDQLIVRAQVDETDIGRIKLGQEAIVSLDAYPDIKVETTVEHIYYESKTVNNVTIYEVDLLLRDIPPILRSGMNATVDFKVESKDNVLLIPVGAVHKENDEAYVLLKQAGSQNPAKRVIEVGITDDKNYEVLAGITAGDTVIITTKKYVFPASGSTGSNPFLPKMHNLKKDKGGPP